MRRTLDHLERDGDGNWIARLDCGHSLPVRHDPPGVEQPWLLDEQGRAAAIGIVLDCGPCDERRWPEAARPYKRTREFDAATVPAGLRARHSTKRGVWARIHVLEGRLRYRIHEPFDVEATIGPGCPGVVLPEVPHDVEPMGAVRFFVEFHRVP
jgi:tellurite methyltransferase